MTIVLDPTPTPAQPLEGRDARLGPLLFPTVEGSLKESLGDALETVGAIAIPGERRPRPFSLQLPVHGMPSDGADYLVQGDRLRGQVRALIENPKARLQGLWFEFDPDHVIDGWLLVGGADLSYTEEGVTFADYLLELTDCYRIGDRHTHRPARLLQARDRRVSTEPRDTLGRIRSTDFASLPVLARHYLPPGTSDRVGATDTTLPTGVPVPTADGDLRLLIGRPNSDVVSYEQGSPDEYRAGVLVRDRKGAITAPAGGADAAWEDVYGPAQALTAGDVPVLENARCRVRYDPTNTPGFRIDVWDGAAWAEQGKVTIQRRGDAFAYCDTLVSASVLEWTSERTVVQAIMRVAANPASREMVLLTLQRGWSGPRIEVYPARRASGGGAGGAINYYPAASDPNVSAIKLDSAGGAIQATAGTGPALFAGAALGAGSFDNMNGVTLLRQGAGYAVVLSVVQALAWVWAGHDGGAYGVDRNVLQVISDLSSYVSVQLDYHPQRADQLMEAEAMALGAGTAVAADAAASGGQATTATRNADAVHVSKGAWPNGARGRYRVFARMKTTAGTLSAYAKTGTTTGATKTTTSPALVWVDLGEVFADGSALEIHAWTTAGTLSVDRVQAYKTEDQTAATPTYDGMRDLALTALVDCRQFQRLTPR